MLDIERYRKKCRPTIRESLAEEDQQGAVNISVRIFRKILSKTYFYQT